MIVEKLLTGYNPVKFLKIYLIKELGDEDHMSNNDFLNIIALNFRLSINFFRSLCER